MKKLKVGIIGAGRIGQVHAKSITYHIPQAEIIAISDIFEEGAKKVAEELGIPAYYKDCFEWAKKRTEYMQNCVLDLVVVEAITYCKDCDSTYPTVKYGRECPHCHSGNTYLVTGQQINIRNIEVKEKEEPSV